MQSSPIQCFLDQQLLAAIAEQPTDVLTTELAKNIILPLASWPGKVEFLA